MRAGNAMTAPDPVAAGGLMNGIAPSALRLSLTTATAWWCCGSSGGSLSVAQDCSVHSDDQQTADPEEGPQHMKPTLGRPDIVRAARRR
jgi:hypothetical protein